MPKSRAIPTVTEPTPPPDPGTPDEPIPTATAQLAVDEAALDAADLAAARAMLEQFRPTAEQALPARRALRSDAAPALARARAEDLGVLLAHRCPSHLLDAFEQAQGRVGADATAVDLAERGLLDLGKLTPKLCRRTAWHHAANEWPWAVQRIRQDLLTMATPLEDIRRHLRDLTELHARIDGWVTGERARGGCLPPRTAKEPIRDEPVRSELAFNPLKVP